MRALIALSFIGILPVGLQAQDPLRPHSPETLAAVLRYMDYDVSMPLNAQVVSTEMVLGFRREKIVFTGAHGDRVPGFLAVPEGSTPAPVVLLVHAGASSKDSWWVPDGYESAVPLTQGLLEAGFALLALDAQYHGERAAAIDYVPIVTLYFENEWWASFRTIVSETVADYRRALDYLTTREDVDASRVGAVGQSLGGMIALDLAAADDRVTTVVAGSAAVAAPWLFPLTSHNASSALTTQAVLLMAGSRDQMIEEAWTQRLYSLIPSSEKRVVVLDSEHRLGEEYIPLALQWIAAHLQPSER